MKIILTLMLRLAVLLITIQVLFSIISTLVYNCFEYRGDHRRKEREEIIDAVLVIPLYVLGYLIWIKFSLMVGWLSPTGQTIRLSRLCGDKCCLFE